MNEDIEKKKLILELVKEHNSKSLTDFLRKNPTMELGFTDELGNNLLHHCVSKVSLNMLETLQVLLHAGIDPVGVNEDFKTPVDLANESNNTPAVALLKYTITMRDKKNQKYILTGEEPTDYIS